VTGLWVKVVTDLEVMGQQVTSFYVVATENEELALEKVRDRVPTRYQVSIVGERVPPEVVGELGLGKNQVWHV